MNKLSGFVVAHHGYGGNWGAGQYIPEKVPAARGDLLVEEGVADVSHGGVVHIPSGLHTLLPPEDGGLHCPCDPDRVPIRVPSGRAGDWGEVFPSDLDRVVCLLYLGCLRLYGVRYHLSLPPLLLPEDLAGRVVPLVGGVVPNHHPLPSQFLYVSPHSVS